VNRTQTVLVEGLDGRRYYRRVAADCGGDGGGALVKNGCSTKGPPKTAQKACAGWSAATATRRIKITAFSVQEYFSFVVDGA